MSKIWFFVLLSCATGSGIADVYKEESLYDSPTFKSEAVVSFETLVTSDPDTQTNKPEARYDQKNTLSFLRTQRNSVRLQ
jgi:hypothetical protein